MTPKRRKALLDDPDVAELEAAFDEVEIGSLKTLDFELDPALAERIRARRRLPLQQLTLRVAADQVQEARRVAKETGRPYQGVLRGWLAIGASQSQKSRAARGKRR